MVRVSRKHGPREATGTALCEVTKVDRGAASTEMFLGQRGKESVSLSSGQGFNSCPRTAALAPRRDWRAPARMRHENWLNFFTRLLLNSANVCKGGKHRGRNMERRLELPTVLPGIESCFRSTTSPRRLPVLGARTAE